MNAQTQDPQEQGSDLQQIIDLLLRHARGAWTYRWWAVGMAWTFALSGWLYVSTLPNTYEASTVVHLDTDSVLRPLLRGLSVDYDVQNEVGIMTRVVTSRPNLESVARVIDLDIEAKTPGEYERELSGLKGRIDISSTRQNLYTLAYSDVDRVRALTVVKTLLDNFVENSLGNNAEDSAQAERALRTQIQEYEKRLRDAEDRLKTFKQENVGKMPGQRGDYYDQLQAAIEQRDEVEQQLRIEKQKREALQRQLVGEEPVFGIMTPVLGGGTQGSSRYDSQIAELERRLNDLSIEYTEEHPEVVRVKNLIKELRAKRDEELSKTSHLDGPSVAANPLDLNPVYQNLKIQLSTIQVEIARLAATLKEKQEAVTHLQNLVNVLPEVEAELTRLNRDYDVVRSRYKEMLERWETLQTSKSVNSGTDEVKFQVIEPPFAPFKPTGPPRDLLNLGILVIALGAGAVLAVAIDLLRPRCLTRQDLALFGFPVLGSIGAAQSPELILKRKRGRIAFSAAIGALACITTAVVYFAESASELVRRVL